MRLHLSTIAILGCIVPLAAPSASLFAVGPLEPLPLRTPVSAPPHLRLASPPALSFLNTTSGLCQLAPAAPHQTTLSPSDSEVPDIYTEPATRGRAGAATEPDGRAHSVCLTWVPEVGLLSAAGALLVLKRWCWRRGRRRRRHLAARVVQAWWRRRRRCRRWAARVIGAAWMRCLGRRRLAQAMAWAHAWAEEQAAWAAADMLRAVRSRAAGVLQAAALGRQVRRRIPLSVRRRLPRHVYLRTLRYWPRARIDRLELLLFEKGTHRGVPWPAEIPPTVTVLTEKLSRKPTSAKQARELKALRRAARQAADVEVFECGGLLYEVPSGAAGARVAREIAIRHGGLGGLVDSGASSGDDSDSDERGVRRWMGVGADGGAA